MNHFSEKSPVITLETQVFDIEISILDSELVISEITSLKPLFAKRTDKDVVFTDGLKRNIV